MWQFDSPFRTMNTTQKTQMDEHTLDEDHPLWCVNEQIKGLLLGYGATEDREMVIDFLRETGLPRGTVSRLITAITCSEKV